MIPNLSPDAKRALGGALVGVCVVVLAVAAGPLAALPVLLAFVPLLAGHYLGSGTLDRLLDARVRARRRHPVDGVARPRPALAGLLPRGGSLIASSLATRPPPAVRALA